LTKDICRFTYIQKINIFYTFKEEVVVGLQDIMKQVEKNLQTKNVMEFSAGDTIAVGLRIIEGDKERIQSFQGVVVQKRGSGMGKSFTLRKASGNIYVERTFPLHSPLISEIKILRKGKVRRARLFYLRELSGKSSRIKEKKQ
jgi:large subunit ribosomal protein L19